MDTKATSKFIFSSSWTPFSPPPTSSVANELKFFNYWCNVLSKNSASGNKYLFKYLRLTDESMCYAIDVMKRRSFAQNVRASSFQ